MLALILRMAAAANVTIGEETIAVYIEELRGYSAQVLDAATKRVVREWSEPSKMPTLAFVLERCVSAHLEATHDILQRDCKPKDWIPLGDGEFKTMLAEAKRKFPATTR